MSIKLTVKATPRLSGPSILIPGQVARSLGLRSGQRVRIRVGPRSVAVRLGLAPRGRPLLWSPDVAHALALPVTGRGWPMRVRAVRGGLRLGPVIGVFTDRVRSGEHPFGKITPLVRQLCRLGRRRGYLVYAFTPDDVHWSDRRVMGYYVAQGRWLRAPLPFPDVIYDRVASRRAARRPALRRIQARLIREVGNRYFNRRFFDKWEIHRLLYRDERLRPHLPATELYHGTDRLLARVRQWGGVWLKPSGGSLGRGIVIVRRGPRGGYLVLFQEGGRWRAGRVDSARGLQRVLRQRMQGGRYLMQRELPLARYQGRPFDVRILMQRGGGGVWRRTKLYARVAAPRGVTSNIAQGGEGLPYRTVAEGASGEVPQRAGEILDKIRELSWLLADALERSTGERLGEVALDLGIDESGHVWFIEANSKPIRAVETETGSMRVVHRALIRPLAYAAHLAGFKSSRQKGDR